MNLTTNESFDIFSGNHSIIHIISDNNGNELHRGVYDLNINVDSDGCCEYSFVEKSELDGRDIEYFITIDNNKICSVMKEIIFKQKIKHSKYVYNRILLYGIDVRRVFSRTKYFN